ncbi:MAG: YaiI/YqxD family protein [Oscillospiraceae bacterium]
MEVFIIKILIDADGCPVVDISVKLAKKYNINCIIVCDTCHLIKKEDATTITVSKGSDSADFKIVNMILPNDIVITGDYGLAAMCLAKNAITVHQNGMIYSDDNIDALLLQRHTAKKIRMAGGRTKGNSKRTKKEDDDFYKTLENILKIDNALL